MAFLIAISILSSVSQNCIFNRVCKKDLTTSSMIYLYNIMVYAVCVILFGIPLLHEKVSLYTVLFGIIFGAATALNSFFKMQALSKGPMHITLLIITSSMIIPAMSGLFYGEKFSPYKLLAVIILLGFIYLSLGKGEDNKTSKGWLLCCIASFFAQGSVGVFQKIHQMSAHKAELNGLLFVAFVFSILYSRFNMKGRVKAVPYTKNLVFFAVICGLCTYWMNYYNLKLSGMMPSQIFFPLINGSSIVLSSLMSLVFFKEKLTKLQLVGLFGGICSLIAICLIP